MANINKKKGAISSDTIIYVLIGLLVLFVVWLFVTGNYKKVGDYLNIVWDKLLGFFNKLPAPEGTPS